MKNEQNPIEINSKNVLVNKESSYTKTKKKKKGCCNFMVELFQLLSENSLNFMNIDEKKLKNIKGGKSKWYGSIKNITVYPILLALIIVMIHRARMEFGTMKSSQINTVEVEHHDIEINEQFPILAVAYIDWGILMQKMKQMQGPQQAPMPGIMAEFKFSDFNKIEEFVCNNTNFVYNLDTLYDQFKLGTDNMFEIKYDFYAKCEIQRWHNNNLRVNYYMGYGKYKNDFKGLKYRMKYHYYNETLGEK